VTQPNRKLEPPVTTTIGKKFSPTQMLPPRDRDAIIELEGIYLKALLQLHEQDELYQ